MKNNITVNVELNHKATKDGRYAIYLRLTKDRKNARYNPNLYVKKQDFNSKAKYGKWLRTSEPRYNELNKRIQNLLEEINHAAIELIEERPGISVLEILKSYKHQNTNDSTWLAYFQKVITNYEVKKKYRYALKLNAIRNKLKDFLGEQNPLISDTNLEFIKSFETYLYSIGNSVNTVQVNLKAIKQIYRQALHDDIVTDPQIKVLEYRLNSTPVERDKLTEIEIETIVNAEIEENSLIWHCRNYFMFAFYCGGMRFGDFVQLRWLNIIDESILKYKMGKTGKIQALKLPENAIKILEYYKLTGNNPNQFIFPLLPITFDNLDGLSKVKLVNAKNSLVNKYLKKLMPKVGINKKISFHQARHSLAYIGFQKTKDIVAIQRLLQHSKLKETQDYVTSLSNDKDRDILGEIFR